MSDEYVVEKIVSARERNGKKEYKIKWEGYDYRQCTWEPLENLENIKELIKDFEENIKNTNNNKNKSGTTLLNKKRANRIREPKKPEDKSKPNKAIDNSKSESKSNDTIEDDDKNETKPFTNNKTYIIDDSLEGVQTVKMINGTLIAIVERRKEDGSIDKEHIPTDELRKTNPWILLSFYESKIKFN